LEDYSTDAVLPCNIDLFSGARLDPPFQLDI
jgi:hypothetical protein